MKSYIKVVFVLLPLVLAAGCAQLPFTSGKSASANDASLTPEQKDARERQELSLGRSLRNSERTGSWPRSEPMDLQAPSGGGGMGD